MPDLGTWCIFSRLQRDLFQILTACVLQSVQNRLLTSVATFTVLQIVTTALVQRGHKT